jgi:hypothetical protein
MKSIKKNQFVEIVPVQPNIAVTYKGQRYDFDKIKELPADIAEELAKLNIVEVK